MNHSDDPIIDQSDLDIDLQIATLDPEVPVLAQFELWTQSVFKAIEHPGGVMTIRLVDARESQELNATYRHKDSPTNVLSFAFEMPHGLPMDALKPQLGDLVICVSIVAKEADEQSKALFDHWAHMVVHGTLHLLGYDHIEEIEAEKMELLETQILCKLGIQDPYKIVN